MENSTLSDELFTSSFDSCKEETDKAPWYGLIHHLTYKGLEVLRDIFKKKSIDDKEIGLTSDEFQEAVCTIYKNTKYSDQSILLFKDIAKNENKINWSVFLEFLIENMCPKTDFPVHLSISAIETVPQMIRETVSKIVVIETEKYFCYAAVSKHGRIGIYDGNLNFLTSYHVIMTEKDLERTDDERRRKNRWVTDAIFCLDIQMFIVTNSTRSIAIYEASGLKHEPYWLIIGCPQMIERLAYRYNYNNDEQTSDCTLFGGTGNGDIIFFKFKQPDTLLLRKKHTEKLSIFYWRELKHEQAYLIIKIRKSVHSSVIEQLEYNETEDAVISCSKDHYASLVKNYVSVSRSPYILKMRKGCDCFAISNVLKIIVTGSSDKIIRIWNSVVISNMIGVLKGHLENILDVAIMDTQHMVLSFSEDGVIKMWEINENRCVQTEKIEFPAYTILGKLIEYGSKNVYPGPKRDTKCSAFKKESSFYKKYFGISEVEERHIHAEEVKSDCLSIWERSNVLVTCCNYIATVRITYDSLDIEKANEMAVLPPPPLQNSVLIPASWQIRTNNFNKAGNEAKDQNIEDALKNLDFILNKDLFDIQGSKSDINYKIAILEAKKMKMKTHVAKGAPYLALNLVEIDEIKISDNSHISNMKPIKKITQNINRMLKEASMKDEAFSEPSTNKSRRSSRRSITSLL